MKKSHKIQNIDCANCAVKMEEAISKIEGVKSARVNFIMGKLIIESDNEDMTDILDKAQAECKKIDRNCRIVF